MLESISTSGLAAPLPKFTYAHCLRRRRPEGLRHPTIRNPRYRCETIRAGPGLARSELLFRGSPRPRGSADSGL